MTIFGWIIAVVLFVVFGGLALCPFILSSRESQREAAESTPLEAVIAATSIIAHDGECNERALLGACDGCPWVDEDCSVDPEDKIARARAWLKARGLGGETFEDRLAKEQ
ncbi:MAG: hypothetical protein WC481_07535 [Candidatus Omnitrophota bacterium]